MEPNTHSPASDERIVAGGGWVETRTTGRPKARLYCMAALLWIFPSGGAAFLIAPDVARWFQADGYLAALRSISFEQWIALAILATHLVFAGLAWHFRRTEPWQEEVFREPNPDHDLQNLH
jgi:hypothetical protein